MYAFTRPYSGQNGLTVVNMAPTEQSTVLGVTNGVAVRFPDDLKPGSTIYLNDLMADTTIVTTPSGLSAVPVILPPFGSKVFTVSMTPDTLKILHPVTEVRSREAAPRRVRTAPELPQPVQSLHHRVVRSPCSSRGVGRGVRSSGQGVCASR